MKKFLEKRLEKASADYYSGNPSMSDDECDALARAVNFKQVGTREGRVPHAYQMYSLQKIFKGEEIKYIINMLNTVLFVLSFEMFYECLLILIL